MTPRQEITSHILSLVCDSLMKHIMGRPIIVSFAHLGQNRDYTIAIQKSLYEFDPEMEVGQEGPMYVTLNRRLLQSTEELLEVLDEIIKAHKMDPVAYSDIYHTGRRLV